ncbi:MAG TPA: hemerythrin domain-containing protein [Ramlibacter sp.]|nr:hemerythrin domain-containing protein [Ramlibacter sp.]
MPQQDACDLLDADHRKVEMLFGQYQSANDATKSQLAQQICAELVVHTTIEEEIFYPAFREAAKDDKLVEEAKQEHQEARDLIAQIEDSEKPDALIAKLQEAIDHHVSEERAEMFPKARATQGLDLLALASRLEARKSELMANVQKV